MDQDAVRETITLVIDDAGLHHRPPGGAQLITREGVPFMRWEQEVEGGLLVSYLKLEHVRGFECEVRP